MVSEWKQARLGDICEVVRGGSPRPIIDYITDDEDGVNWLKIGDVKETDKYFTHANERIKKSGIPKTREVKKGDLILSNSMSFGRAFITLIDGYIHDGWLRLRCDERVVSKEYLYYFLVSSIAQNQFKAVATGSVVNNLKSDTVKDTTIDLPPMSVQKQIVAILDALDQEIIINQKINDNLQQQVYALFESWFVSFDRTDGKMPADWHEGTLDEIASITSGKRPPIKKSTATADVTIPLVGAASIMGFTNAVLYNEPILVTGRVGTHGVVQRFQSPCWTSDNTLVIKSDYYEYAFQALQRVDYVNMNRGSTQPLITQTDLKNVSIVIPAEEVLLEYEKIAGSLMAMYESNRKENGHLAALRDTLLPRLMSGEIDVSGIEV